MKITQKKKYSSLAKTDTGLWEMVYEEQKQTTQFVALENSTVVFKTSLGEEDQAIFPFAPDSNLIRNKVVLFPSHPQEYGSDAALLSEIQAFVHKYLEISPFFEKIVPFYVLFTWVYDSFNELPYLRALADFGCGKSRFLKTIGSICYKPAFTAGATNPAPIFRIIDQFKGTLVIDEADMRFSDTNCEIVKILNNGFQTGMPVLRCATKEKNFDVESFDVFGPKIVATRERYQDQALESRFLVERLEGKLTRTDIPLNLDGAFDKEALTLRNKCLLWRLRNYGKKQLDPSLQDRSIAARLNQVVTPLLSIIDDPTIRTELMSFIKKYDEELTTDRGFNFEAPILEITIRLMEESHDKEVTMQQIADAYNVNLVQGEKQLSARKIGNILREKFQLKTRKINPGYIVDSQSYLEHIPRLKAKYGLTGEHVNVVNVVGGIDPKEMDLKQELEKMGFPTF